MTDGQLLVNEWLVGGYLLVVEWLIRANKWLINESANLRTFDFLLDMSMSPEIVASMDLERQDSLCPPEIGRQLVDLLGLLASLGREDQDAALQKAWLAKNPDASRGRFWERE